MLDTGHVTELVKRHNDGDYRVPDKVTVGEYLTGRCRRSGASSRRRPSTPTRATSASTSCRRSARSRSAASPPRTSTPSTAGSSSPDDGTTAATVQASAPPACVRYIHRILRKALGDAVRKGSIARNPASLADPPKRSTTNKREGEVVSERLGHATASFTLDVYGWVLPGMQAEAAAVFSRQMAANPSTPEQLGDEYAR